MEENIEGAAQGGEVSAAGGEAPAIEQGGAAQGESQAQGQSQGDSGDGNSKFVPYSRFQEQNAQLGELRERYAQLQAMMDGLNKKPEKTEEDLRKTYEEEFYKDPIGTMMKINERSLGTIKQEQAQKQAAENIEGAKKWFRSQDGYSTELEDKAAEFITSKGLNKLDPKVAVELAYEFLTKTEGSGYVRGVKEGLRKPGMGGAAPKFDLNTELAKIDPKLPPAEFEAKMREVWTKVNGGVKQ